MKEKDKDICPELTDFYKSITKCGLLCDVLHLQNYYSQNILKQKRSQQRLIDDLHSTLRRITEKIIKYRDENNFNSDEQYVLLFLNQLKPYIKQLEDTVNILQDQLSKYYINI